jgi:hypothetical protein
MPTLLTREHHTIMLYGLEEVPAPGYIYHRVLEAS